MVRKKSRRNAKPKPEDRKTIKRAPESPNELITTFWRRLVKAAPLILLALLFTFVLNRAGLFSQLEKTFLDIQMLMSTPEDESSVVIVEIDEKDFAEVFEGKRSPLNPPVLQQLVEEIARGEPCVVGVDVGTDFDQFSNFRTEALGNFVWARDFLADSERIVPRRVLGRETAQSDGILSGLPRTISENGVTRYYTRMVETTGGRMPSFAWTIIEKAKERKCPGIKVPELEESNEMLSIGFSRGPAGVGRTRVPASHIRKFDKDGWENKELIKGKIVLLGGSYLNPEDRRPTPLGMMHGFAINANVIETELRGGGVKPPSTVTIVLLQLFDGVLLMALFQIFPWRKAALLSLPFILVLSFACSFLTYWSFSHWAFFAPVMLGVLATELFDKGKDYFKKRYKEEITETYSEITGTPPAAKQK